MNRHGWKTILPACVVLALAGFSPPPAAAEIGTLERTPAATLFFPYVQVDLAACGGSGLNTLMTITNATSESVLAHFTLWTDLAVGALNFDIYLTGYDVYSVDLAVMLCDGIIEPTGSAVSPHGALSGGPASFPGCSDSATPGEAPNYAVPAIDQFFRDHLHAWLTGQPSSALGTCAGTAYGDQIARGFVTVDVAQVCTVRFPVWTSYFDQIASTSNALLGEYLYVDTATGRSAAFPAVSIEASAGSFLPGSHTFYGRYVEGDASDQREPTSSQFAARFLASGPASDTTWLVYRETPETPADPAAGFNCASGPSWAPLDTATVTFFDEEENVVTADVALNGGSHAYEVTADLVNPYAQGWALVDLAHGGLPVYDDGFAQGWLTVLFKNSLGEIGGGFHGVALSESYDATPERIFSDGFESGNTSAWSAAIP